MNWEIDLNMKDGQIARSYNDNGSFCILETIEGREKSVSTSFGPVVYEYEQIRGRKLIPSFDKTITYSKPKKRGLPFFQFCILLFIGVFTLTLTLLHIWGILS